MLFVATYIIAVIITIVLQSRPGKDCVGNISYCVGYGLIYFPVGLSYAIPNVYSDFVTLAAYLAYLAYLTITVIGVLTKKRRVFVVLYVIFILLLVVNIAACQGFSGISINTIGM